MRGENRIQQLGERSKAFLDKGIVRLVKDPQTGQGSFLPVETLDQVIRLAGVGQDFDLAEWGVDPEVLRAFAWWIILAFRGPLNWLLLNLGLIEDPIRWTNMGYTGVVIGLIYTYVLFMLFPIYNAVQSLDTNQIEAAEDLGAPWWKIHRDVVIPYAKPGIASGCTMVFMLSAGSLAAPQFLGGPRTLWFTSIVYDFFFQSFNWPRGAAYAFILLLACIAFVLLMLRVFKVSLGETIR